MKKFTPIFLTAAIFLIITSGQPAVAAETGDFSTAIEDVAKIVGPSVVAIKTQTTEHYQARRYYGGGSPFEDELFNQFFEDFLGPVPDYELKRAGLGSGVIIDKAGYILTNAHVVDNAQHILVTLPDGRDFPATVKGIDPSSDLAVIKIEGTDLPVAKLGDSTELKIGQWVVALGNPFGNLLSDPIPTLTAGVISALHRALPQTSIRDTDYSDLIQTDAAINPGNSGGPLVNLKGEIVGINVAIFSTTGGYQGVGFAIPVNYAKNFVNQITKGEPITYGWMGLGAQNINPRLAKYFGLSTTDGALIVKIAEGSPAQKAGLKEGDIVLAINDIKIRNSTALVKFIGQATTGKEVSVSVWRDKKKMALPVLIEKRPDFNKLIPKAATEPEKPAAPLRNEWRGLKVGDVTDNMVKTFHAENIQGALITDIEQNGRAAEAGLQAGDIIVAVNRTPVQNAEQFNTLVTNVKGSCLIRTLRGYFVVEE